MCWAQTDGPYNCFPPEHVVHFGDSNTVFFILFHFPPTCKSINTNYVYVFKHIPLSPIIMGTNNKLPFLETQLISSPHSVFPCFPCFYDSGRIRGVVSLRYPPRCNPHLEINSINLLHHCKCNSLGTCKCGDSCDMEPLNPGWCFFGILMA